MNFSSQLIGRLWVGERVECERLLGVLMGLKTVGYGGGELLKALNP